MTIQMLNDRYQVVRTLGAGGFGETYLAEDTYMPSKRRCVVKQLRPIQNNPQIYQLVQERFQREAAILEELGGATDQIPALYAYFSANEQFYLVQEWIEGDTLTAKIQQQGILHENVVQALLVNLLPVLEYVHSKQIIHRDIKPDNIILRYSDGKPVLIDFGAVRESMGTVINSQGNTTSSIVIGTPGYMPSEQAAGRPVYSSDLYSLGLTAVYLLTGMQPQNLETDSQTGEIIWRSHVQHISPVLANVIDRAIAYHPRDRFPTAKVMLDALQSSVEAIPPTQAVLPPTEAVLPPTQAVARPPIQPLAGNPIPKPVVTTPKPTKVTMNTQVQTSGSNRNAVIIGGLIASGLIGGSVIIGQVLTKPSANPKNVISSITPSDVPPLVVETPVASAPPTPINPPSPLLPPETSSNDDPANLPSTDLGDGLRPTNGGRMPTSDRNNIPLDRQRPPLEPIDAANYFWLSQRPANDADLEGKSGFELDIMRNTIFAVHGRRFNDPGIQEFFDHQPWYRPLYSPREFPAKSLSKLEMRNVAYIAKYQDRSNLRYFRK